MYSSIVKMRYAIGNKNVLPSCRLAVLSSCRLVPFSLTLGCKFTLRAVPKLLNPSIPKAKVRNRFTGNVALHSEPEHLNLFDRK